jgi:hypothetical protein
MQSTLLSEVAVARVADLRRQAESQALVAQARQGRRSGLAMSRNHARRGLRVAVGRWMVGAGTRLAGPAH